MAKLTKDPVLRYDSKKILGFPGTVSGKPRIDQSLYSLLGALHGTGASKGIGLASTEI